MLCADASELDAKMLEFDSQKQFYKCLIDDLQKQVEAMDAMAKECRLKRDDLFDEIYANRIEFLECQEEFLKQKQKA
jgi:CCR4-NOT transcriptional regulation complex NOT5 subunit